MYFHVLAAIVSRLNGWADFQVFDCPYRSKHMLSAGVSLEADSYKAMLDLNPYSSGFVRSNLNGMSFYSLVDNLSAQVIVSDVGVPKNVSLDLISTNLVAFALSYAVEPTANPVPYLIFPFLIGGESGLGYRDLSLGIRTKVHPFLRRGLSYQIGPVLSVSMGVFRLSAFGSVEINDFENSSLSYARNQFGISAGLSK